MNQVFYKKAVFFIFFFLFVFSCKEMKMKKELSKSLIKLNININDSIFHLGTKNVTDIIDSIQIIQLRGNIGAKNLNISSISLMKNRLFIHDRNKGDLYIFDTVGNPMYNFESLSINAFYVDTSNEKIFLMDREEGNLKIASLKSGEIFNEKTIQSPTSSSFILLNEDSVFFDNSYIPGESNYSLLEYSIKDNKIFSEGLKIDNNVSQGSFIAPPYPFFRFKDTVFYTLPHSYKIYCLYKKTIQPYLDIDFGEDLDLPSGFMTQKYNGVRRKILNSAYYVNFVDNFTTNENWIFFDFSYLRSMYHCKYSKKNKKYEIFNSFALNDSLPIPLLKAFSTQQQVCYYSFFYVYPTEMKSAIDFCKTKHIQIPNKFNALIKKLNLNSKNPIIIWGKSRVNF